MNWKYRLWRSIAGAYALAASRGPKPGLRVLCYHAIDTALPGDPYGLSLPLSSFRRQMELIASGALGRPVSLGAADPGRPEPQVCVTFDDGFRDTLTKAAPVLAEFKLPFTACVTPGFLDRPDGVYLSQAELQELSRVPGAEIGAHGLTHLKLARCDDATLDRELSESRARLEALIGKTVSAMSYPHGSADRRTRDAAERAGYATAGCSRYGLNGPGRDRLLLCRTEIVGWDDETAFLQKATGAWDWYRFRHRDPARA